MLQITFHTRKLQKHLSTTNEMKKNYTPKVVKAIQLRMTQLNGADNLGQIETFPPVGLHKLEGDRKNQYAVWVKEKYRIIFYGIDQDNEIITEPGYPKDKITKIRIIEVVNYHV